jgi:hypothetical protein
MLQCIISVWNSDVVALLLFVLAIEYLHFGREFFDWIEYFAKMITVWFMMDLYSKGSEAAAIDTGCIFLVKCTGY